MVKNGPKGAKFSKYLLYFLFKGVFQLWAFNTLSKHPYCEWFLLTCSYWEKSNNVDFSDFTVKYFLKEMSSSRDFFF